MISAAIYIPSSNVVSTHKLNPLHSILEVELFAVQKALEFVKTQIRYQKIRCVIVNHIYN